MNAGMIAARSLLFAILFYLALIAIMIVGSPAFLMRRSAVYALARIWARTSIWLLRHVCGVRTEFRGLEKLPPAPFILAAKHQSVWETFALSLVVDDFTFILKRELTFIPLFGWYLAKTEQVAIDRSKGGNSLSQAIAKAKQIFADKRVLIIFPEGTRRPAGAPPKYKFGVAHIYDASGVPCVPVALNSGLFWPRRSFLRRPGTIVVEILDPIAPGLPKDVFFKTFEERLEAASDRLIAESLAADPALKPIVEANRRTA